MGPTAPDSHWASPLEAEFSHTDSPSHTAHAPKHLSTTPPLQYHPISLNQLMNLSVFFADNIHSDDVLLRNCEKTLDFRDLNPETLLSEFEFRTPPPGLVQMGSLGTAMDLFPKHQILCLNQFKSTQTSFVLCLLKNESLLIGAFRNVGPR